MSGVLLGVLVGLAAGIASGLAGVGGGVILVPAMVYLLDVGQHVAQGTSTVAMLFTAAAGTFFNVRNRHVDVKGAMLIGLGGAITGFAGARLAVLADAEMLRRLFGLLVVLSGARMGVGAWQDRRREHAAR